MKHRLERLRASLEDAGCDSFVSLDTANNQYLTGFIGTTSAVIVTADKAQFLCDFRYIEQAREQVSPEFEIELLGTGFLARVGERLKHLGLSSTAFESSYMQVSQVQALEKTAERALVPRSELVSRLRQIKDADEIAAIRAASLLAEGVLADVIPQLSVGVSEREVAATIEYEFKKRGATGPSFDTIVLFGARSSLPHGQPTDAQLREGDIVLIDFGCRNHGYCSDLTRTYVFGTIPGAWFETVYKLTLSAQCAAIEAVQPGMTCKDLDAVARCIISDAGHGEAFGHGLGHGLGIEIHEAPRLNAESETILTPGMVVTIEPGVYLPGQGGVRIEDVIVVTGAGCELLSDTNKELMVVGR